LWSGVIINSRSTESTFIPGGKRKKEKEKKQSKDKRKKKRRGFPRVPDCFLHDWGLERLTAGFPEKGEGFEKRLELMLGQRKGRVSHTNFEETRVKNLN